MAGQGFSSPLNSLTNSFCFANQCMFVRSVAGGWDGGFEGWDDWGTTVTIENQHRFHPHAGEVFDMYAPPSDEHDLEFSRTRLILKLAKEMNVGFVSRSEAGHDYTAQ